MRRLILKLFRRRRLQQDLEAELAFHREMAAQAGNDIPFGNATGIKERALELWRFNFIENLWRDLACGLRALRRNPALVASAVVSLALAIGANAAIFSLAVEFLLSKPSVTHAGSLVAARIAGSSHVSQEEFDMVRGSGLFADVAGENEETFLNWDDGTETRRLFSVAVTKNYFTLLGVPVAQGRGILPDDPEQVVVLQHTFWVKHLAGDPSALGRSLNLDGRAYTIIGILPPSHRTLMGFGYSPDLYIPRYLATTNLAMYARLKPGMTFGEAEAGLRTVAARIDAAMPERYKRTEACTARPIAGFARLKKEIITVGLFFVALLAIAGLVLLIACVNVAGLLLARAETRRREMAIRLSLGAGRARLLQQLLVESLLLAVAGAACGLLIAQAVASAVSRISPPLPFPIHLHVDPDWRVALYAALLTVITTIACGLLPALQTVRESISAGLHREQKLRLRRLLVAGQIAVSLIVLTTGFLFVRNLFQAASISPGFDVRHTLRAEVNLPPRVYNNANQISLYADRALARLEVIPGIEAVAAARIVPFTDATNFSTRFGFDNGEAVQVRFRWNAVTPAFFQVMGIPVNQGRSFTRADNGSAMAVIVNETFVNRYLKGRSPLGVSFFWGEDGKVPYRIAGVAAPTKTMFIGEDDQPQLYEPLAQIRNDRPRIQFVLRSSIPPALQLDAVRKALRDIEPAAGAEVATLYSSIGLAFLPSQVGAILMGSVGLLGLVLAAVGLYGTMSYSVARRTRELGIRMAIGAGRREISRMVLLDAARLMGAGSAVGLFIAWFVTKPLASFLVPGLNPGDPVTYLAVLAVLAITGLFATWAPVRRAAAIDPASCLRYE